MASSSPPSDTTKDTAEIRRRHHPVLVRLVAQAEVKAGVDGGLSSGQSVSEHVLHPAQFVEQCGDVAAGEARAANQPPERQADSYRAALELVTGKVFSYPSRAGSSFAWIDTENLLSQWEHKIQAIAQQCVETYLDLGDHDQAIEVANHVLQALPLNTSLTEALMRAHAATGDLAAVEPSTAPTKTAWFASSTPTPTTQPSTYTTSSSWRHERPAHSAALEPFPLRWLTLGVQSGED